jgi:hypothetical protein
MRNLNIQKINNKCNIKVITLKFKNLFKDTALYLIWVSIITSVLFHSCSTPQQVNTTSFKDELNDSIIDGFYNNDTTGISQTIYLIK